MIYLGHICPVYSVTFNSMLNKSIVNNLLKLQHLVNHSSFLQFKNILEYILIYHIVILSFQNQVIFSSLLWVLRILYVYIQLKLKRAGYIVQSL